MPLLNPKSGSEISLVSRCEQNPNLRDTLFLPESGRRPLKPNEMKLTFIITFLLSGPPIAGFLVDQTGGTENAFYLSAALLFTSAILCVPAWLAQKAVTIRRNSQ